MWELLARLEGELRKDAAENPRGVSLIILNNQGRGRLDPEIFREAARRKALEARASTASGSRAGVHPERDAGRAL
jgi:hypothetical protein